MKLKKLFVISMLVLSLAACSDSEKSNAESPSSKKTALEKTLQPQLDAIDKAEAVEDEVLKSFDEREQKLRDSGI